MTARDGYALARVRVAQAADRARLEYDQQPMTSRCMWCDWTWHGPAGKAREQAARHRATRRHQKATEAA